MDHLDNDSRHRSRSSPISATSSAGSRTAPTGFRLIAGAMIQIRAARARVIGKDTRLPEPQPICRRLLAALAALALAGCMPAMAPAPPASTTPVGQCLAQFEAQDAQIAANGVSPSSPRRIDGFPYLRTDRFPTDRLRQDPTSLRLPEPPLIPQPVPSPGHGERLVLRLTSGSHYLERVYADRPSGTDYGWQDYSALYAIPDAEGSPVSLFRADGLVAGTKRAERHLLWPTGVLEPGAMRERGRQAIAFLGRRHFDDADLLDALFRPAE
jgi:hypothetical protein